MSTTYKTALIAAVLALGCSSSKSEKLAEGGSNALPLPNKLPPAGSATAPPQGQHATSIDRSYSAVRAMYEAPEGATPCESAYNAFTAEQEAAKPTARGSIFSFVAPRAEFVKHCEALPVASQQCLVPRYQARNQASCLTAKAPPEKTDALFMVRKDLDAITDDEPVPSP